MENIDGVRSKESMARVHDGVSVMPMGHVTASELTGACTRHAQPGGYPTSYTTHH